MKRKSAYVLTLGLSMLGTLLAVAAPPKQKPLNAAPVIKANAKPVVKPMPIKPAASPVLTLRTADLKPKDAGWTLKVKLSDGRTLSLRFGQQVHDQMREELDDEYFDDEENAANDPKKVKKLPPGRDLLRNPYPETPAPSVKP